MDISQIELFDLPQVMLHVLVVFYLVWCLLENVYV